jgi:predicted secreted protein
MTESSCNIYINNIRTPPIQQSHFNFKKNRINILLELQQIINLITESACNIYINNISTPPIHQFHFNLKKNRHVTFT